MWCSSLHSRGAYKPDYDVAKAQHEQLAGPMRNFYRDLQDVYSNALTTA